MLFRTILAITLSLLITETAFALRCSRHVIEEGDSIDRVLKYCGAPTTTQTRSIFRNAGTSFTEVAAGETSLAQVRDGVAIEIIVEQWNYNFGPRRLSREILFENGVVRSIEETGYGY